MIQFDEHIFGMGWFNHQLENVTPKNRGKFGNWKETYCFTKLELRHGKNVEFDVFLNIPLRIHGTDGIFTYMNGSFLW